MKLYDICIIGGGTAGMLALSMLPDVNICIIDPYFDGGDLFRRWHSVESNTRLEKTVSALRLIDPDYSVPEKYKNYALEKTTPLYVCANLLKDFVVHRLKAVDLLQGSVRFLNYKDNLWNIVYGSSTVKSKIVLLCNGSTPKVLDCGIPTIPLEKALCKNSLRNYVKEDDKVILFGTSHSGTLVLEHLEDLKIKTVAVYNKSTPFEFACDGHYDGIKEDAERIARSILDGLYKSVTLVSLNDTVSLLKASARSTWSIYCVGFKQNNDITICVNDVAQDASKFDGKTGKIDSCPAAWGFGIGYPSTAPDSIHVDVGIYSFAEHIQKQIMDIKHLLN